MKYSIFLIMFFLPCHGLFALKLLEMPLPPDPAQTVHFSSHHCSSHSCGFKHLEVSPHIIYSLHKLLQGESWFWWLKGCYSYSCWCSEFQQSSASNTPVEVYLVPPFLFSLCSPIFSFQPCHYECVDRVCFNHLKVRWVD